MTGEIATRIVSTIGSAVQLLYPFALQNATAVVKVKAKKTAYG